VLIGADDAEDDLDVPAPFELELESLLLLLHPARSIAAAVTEIVIVLAL
jgi:hypothetical protein